jgi:hypothetical protein
MPNQGSYPIGGRQLALTDTATGVVTGSTADIPISYITTLTQQTMLGTFSGYLSVDGMGNLSASNSIPAGSVTGLGSMASQNSGSVSITGGSINGTFSGNAVGLNIGGNAGTATLAATATQAINVVGGTANQIPRQSAAGTTVFIAAPTTANTVLTWNGAALGWVAPAVSTSLPPRNYIDGFTIALGDPSASGNLTAFLPSFGQAANSTNTIFITNSTAYTTGKLLTAWVAGDNHGGKLSAAALIANHTYHWYTISNATGSLVDFGFDASATSPTLPSGYTTFRRIASLIYDGNGWVNVWNLGDDFFYLHPPTVSQVNPGTGAVSLTLPLPTGINVYANIGLVATELTAFAVVLSSPDHSDFNSPSTAGPLDVAETTTLSIGYSNKKILTNTSAQITTQRSVSAAADVFNVTVHGWTDLRGKNS